MTEAPIFEQWPDQGSPILFDAADAGPWDQREAPSFPLLKGFRGPGKMLSPASDGVSWQSFLRRFFFSSRVKGEGYGPMDQSQPLQNLLGYEVPCQTWIPPGDEGSSEGTLAPGEVPTPQE